MSGDPRLIYKWTRGSIDTLCAGQEITWENIENFLEQCTVVVSSAFCKILRREHLSAAEVDQFWDSVQAQIGRSPDDRVTISECFHKAAGFVHFSEHGEGPVRVLRFGASDP
jgi:hypothetical protein